jgi:anti-sigma B factor antagonist
MQVREKLFSSQLRSSGSAAPADEHAHSVGLIEVGERLDARAAERMKSRFKQFAKEGRSEHIIDLSRLDDLDSGGLASLISTLRAVRESGGCVHLVANSDRVTYILELTALTRLFKVHPTVKAALAAI